MQNEPREPEIGYERALDCIGSMLLFAECELTKHQPETSEHTRIYEQIVALNLALDCLERERDGVVSAYECEAARAECLRRAAPDILRAEWIYFRDDLGLADIRFAECSNCKEVSSPVYHYCPHCGAYMSNRRG